MQLPALSRGTYDIVHADGRSSESRHAAGENLGRGEDANSRWPARSDNPNAPIDSTAQRPIGGDGSPGPYGTVRRLNNFWLDPVTAPTVDGQKRASLLSTPPYGACHLDLPSHHLVRPACLQRPADVRPVRSRR